ncbi:MAG: type 1 glutamine amidotransferase [Planctomycetota bacterium]|nr:type 1 glutamine amidotransferase [Planctomycetota bacterium]
MASQDDMSVFLFQVRADNVAAKHERDCIVETGRIDRSQLGFVNLATDPRCTADLCRDADAVLIGGSASHSVVNDDPFTEDLITTVRTIADRRQPLLGSCWGHQFIARALGGEVLTDPEHGEVGVVEVDSTPDAGDDPLFCSMPDRYPVLMGHHDRVATLPDGCRELAFSASCRNQAFCLEGYPVYGTQFHAELLPEQLVERLTMFRQYMPDDDEFEMLKASMRPTPDSGRLLRRFFEEIVGS